MPSPEVASAPPAFVLALTRAADLFQLASVLHHVTLALFAAVIASGNRKPGYQLLSLGFAGMCFSGFIAAQEFELPLLSIGWIVLMLCLLADAVKPLTAWTFGGKSARKPGADAWIGWTSIVLGVVYPVYVKPVWLAPLAAPIGVVPTPTLLVLLGCLWLAWPQTNRLVHWAAVIFAVAAGGAHLVIASAWIDLALLGIALGSGWRLTQSVKQSGGVFEDDLTPAEKGRKPAPKTKRETVYKLR